MLGHNSFQSDKNSTFSIIPSTFSRMDAVTEILSAYMVSDPVILGIYSSLQDRVVEFLNIFGGSSIDFRSGLTDNQLKYTHIPEIRHYFGQNVLDKLYKSFGGQVIHVPPSNTVRVIIRDIDIYLNVSTEKKDQTSPTVRKLASHYKITPQEVYWSVKRVRKVLSGG